MRKYLYAFFVLASLTACTTEKSTVGGYHEFTAVAVGNDVPTRSHIAYPNPENDPTNADGKIVHWNRGDKLCLYDVTFREFTCAADGGDVTISGEIADEFDGVFYAMYPWESCLDFRGTTYSTVVRVNQYIASGDNWDPDAPIVVGSCNWDERLIKFYNAHCLVEMYLPGAADGVTLMLGTNEDISGIMDVDVTTLNTTVTKGSNTISLTGDMSAHSPYYLAVTPTQASAGFHAYIHFTSPFTVGGATYQAGEYSLSNRGAVSFNRDRIVVLDMTSATPSYLEAVLINPHLEEATYLFRAEDGSCTLDKTHGGSADKADWINAPVYDFNKQGPLTITELQNYQFNQTGWSKALDRDSEGTPRYFMQLNGKGSYAGYYLKYDSFLQGFYMVRDESEATRFYAYIIS